MYKEDVFELVAEKIYTRDLEPELAVPVLRGLALTTDVTEKMCNDISVRNKLTCLLILRAPTFWEMSIINCYFLRSTLKISLRITCFPSLVKDLCSRAAVQEDEALRMTCYLTSGALMHEYCKKRDHTCLTDKATVT